MQEPTHHPNAFELECFSVQALAPQAARVVEVHLRGCRKCQAYLDELEEGRKTMLAEESSGQFVQCSMELALAPRRRSILKRFGSQTRLRMVGYALAFCALFIMVFVLATYLSRSDSRRLRHMGSLQVSVYLKRGSSAMSIGDNATVAPHESVRFKVHLSQDGFLGLFFMNQKGELSWYLPRVPSEEAVAVKKGEYLVPGSAIFDDSPHTERAFIVFNRNSFRIGDIAEKVRQSWRSAPGKDFLDPSWTPDIETLWTTAFIKK